MASQTTTQTHSWMNNSYVVALFQVLMGFGLVWLIRSTCQLMKYMRKGASTDNELVSTRNNGDSADVELGELNGPGMNGVDLNSGPEAIQGISLPQRAHRAQEHGHKGHGGNATGVRGVVGSEPGELHEQEVDDVVVNVGLQAAPGINLPRHVSRPQEHGHGQHGAHEHLSPTL